MGLTRALLSSASYSGVAQLVAQGIVNPKAAGSSPAPGATQFGFDTRSPSPEYPRRSNSGGRDPRLDPDGGRVDNGWMPKLSEPDIDAALAQLPGWQREGDEIMRMYELPSFPEAIEFVRRIADLAEAADHHPDLDIRYRKVRAALTTHDQGGLTALDFELARDIDATSGVA
jgi:4a-hydroxytetrahydrobiopterin dehydratase